ncbi:MAG: hypothetical protein ACREE9_05075 [Stellaceae bacterium]
MQWIEAILGTLAGKADSLASGMATLRGEMATKQDLTGMANNVDVTALGRQMRELLALKDDIRVLTAVAQRLDNTMAHKSVTR